MRILTTALLLALAGPALAQDAAGGTLNPDEMSRNRVLEDAREGRTGMATCAAGYLITKEGNHAAAREVFEACAEAGYTAAMNWMAQMANNGLGGTYDPDAAARWSRRSAEAGDPIGKLNHGIDLIRGHGIARDEARGRALVDEAAREGVAAARRLRAAGYDLDEVTPDADDWRYAPMF